ncbi:uncharacterized protein BBA_08627 [Beauveria bassiana ARSEF 2860]|uniref:Uncharacterized protein n=1 Tax=Beauveria bassiana (strain ARSEF 2860) TaxID=655819 RepID=J5JFK3_BEAB2|nr:uncharacterized protein BBA_08627 [Beauveria bassiana ARSEF 2860]EJP62406.1 hypothetical protein BBA_08627 [Beauveria bassiana ARSEF 2860]
MVFQRLLSAVAGASSATTRDTQERCSSTTRAVPRPRRPAIHNDEEVQEPRRKTVPRTPQNVLIHQLQSAFTDIGEKDIALQLRNLPPSAQKTLAETIQAFLPKVIQNDGSKAKLQNLSDASLPEQSRDGPENLKRSHMEEQAKLKAEIDALHRTNAKLQSQLDLANARVQSVLQRENTILGNMIPTDEGPAEGSLRECFARLRKQIQVLGNSPVYASSGKSTCPYVPRSSREAELFFDWSAADYSMFGVFTIAAASGGEQRDFQILERALGRLEEAFETRKIAKRDIANWRTATVRCVQSCQKDDDFSDALASKMYTFFERFVEEDVETIEIYKLKERFSQLCRDAVSVRLQMRGSEDYYRCVTLERGLPLSGNEDIADPYAVYNGDDNENASQISFTVFGALVMYPKLEPDREVILEQAIVAMASENA